MRVCGAGLLVDSHRGFVDGREDIVARRRGRGGVSIKGT